MTNRSTPPLREQIDALLQDGLEHYGRNELAAAVACWREVLAVAPDDPRALDYLQTVEADMPAPAAVAGEAPRVAAPADDEDPWDAGGQDAGPGLDRALAQSIAALVRQQRYEEALAALQRARLQAPQDETISRGIRVLKTRLIRAAVGHLGNLDLVPRMSSLAPPVASLSYEEQEVLRLVDGIAAYDDILGASRLGTLATLRTLIRLVNEGFVTALHIELGELGGAAPRPVGRDWSGRFTVVPPGDRRPTVRPIRPPPEPPPPGSASRLAVVPPSVVPDPPPAADERPRFTVEAPPPPAPAPPPPPDVAAPTPAPAREAAAPVEIDAYGQLFARATQAYLRRDYDAALRLFEQCVETRPHDARAAHNRDKLRERRRREEESP